jgi:hypothetical protein
MGILIDAIIALPIGIIYNMLVHQIGEASDGNMEYNEKLQKNLLVTFVGAIVAFMLAYSFFSKGKYKNRSVRFGLYLGTALLILHSIGYNWNILRNDTKIIVMCITLGILIWYTIVNVSHTEGKKKKVKDDEDYLSATYINYPKENFREE